MNRATGEVVKPKYIKIIGRCHITVSNVIFFIFVSYASAPSHLDFITECENESSEVRGSTGVRGPSHYKKNMKINASTGNWVTRNPLLVFKNIL